MVYQESHIVFEGQLGLWKFEEYIHAFPSQFLFHVDAEIDVVNGPAPGAFGVAGNRIVRIHAIAHEGGRVVRGDVIDDGDFVEERSLEWIIISRIISNGEGVIITPNGIEEQ